MVIHDGGYDKQVRDGYGEAMALVMTNTCWLRQQVCGGYGDTCLWL